jgi:hypothetical protein
MTRRWTAAIAILLATMLVGAATAACGGSSGGDSSLFPDAPAGIESDVVPSITNQALAVGDNRVTIQLADKNAIPVLDAAVRLRFFDLNGKQPRAHGEANARFIPVELSYVDEANNNTTTVLGGDGAYVAHADFDVPGAWGVLITVTRDGKSDPPLPFRFNVLEKPLEPAIGDPAPPSRQETLATAASIEDIDTSSPSRPQMHDVTIADALMTGRPLVIAFATPAFCFSRTCGPVMDTVMDPLYARYNDQAVFIHVEPYALPQLRTANQQELVPAMLDWRLNTEPWIFVVDRAGKVADKFESIVALDEVESALVRAIDAPPGVAAPAPTVTP